MWVFFGVFVLFVFFWKMSQSNCLMKFSSLSVCLTKDKIISSAVLHSKYLGHVRCWEIPLLERESVNGKLQKRSCFWKACISYILLVSMFLFAP